MQRTGEKLMEQGSQKRVRMVFKDRRSKCLFNAEGSRGLQMQINFYLSKKLREFTLSFSFLYKVRSKSICRRGCNVHIIAITIKYQILFILTFNYRS